MEMSGFLINRNYWDTRKGGGGGGGGGGRGENKRSVLNSYKGTVQLYLNERFLWGLFGRVYEGNSVQRT